MQKQLSGYLKVLYDANAESIGARYQKMSLLQRIKRKRRTNPDSWAVAVWLFVWQAVSVWIGQEILLVSPVVVLERLTGLVMETEFWRSIGFSLVRILGGFFLAAAAGILAAGLSAKFERIREFLLLR